jgi:hypothetical protein
MKANPGCYDARFLNVFLLNSLLRSGKISKLLKEYSSFLHNFNMANEFEQETILLNFLGIKFLTYGDSKMEQCILKTRLMGRERERERERLRDHEIKRDV